MKFLKVVEKLQEKNEGYIVIIKNGVFFVGIGKDAILMNKILDLKLVCMKEGLCKVGFIGRSLEKYINLLSLSGKAFVIYEYNKKVPEETKQIFRFSGEKVYETRCSLDCEKCSNKKESEEEIIERVINNAKNTEK